MPKGDHIFVRRLGYTHHGIDAGDGMVIHYTGELGQKSDAAVRETPIDDFAKGSAVRVRLYGEGMPPEDVVARARSLLGERSSPSRGVAPLCSEREHALTGIQEGDSRCASPF